MQTHKVEEEVGTLLYYASKGNVQIIKHMLDNGTAVDAADYDGRTALHLAASEGHVAAVKLLLSYNANVNPSDRYNDTVSLVPRPHSAFYLIRCFLMLFITCETLFLKWPGTPRIFYHSSIL
jgi:ankyrin repeat protein